MTEQEIVNYLKENKNKGIAFGFMPKEVKEWCSINDYYLVYYSVNGTWLSGDNRLIFDANEIVALPDSYELPVAKVKGEWVEFKINDNGQFRVVYEDEQYASYYDWFYWQLVLEKSKDLQERNQITAFGGWQYEDSKRWYLAPAVKLHGDFWNSYVIEEIEDATPAIPVKIRFWREIK